MQEDRKLTADWQISLALELLRIGADHDPVALASRQPEQAVTHRTPHQVHLHRRMLTETRILLAGLILAVLPGCYLLQAAHGEAQLLEERRPIMKVIGNPRTAPSLRLTLEDLVAARDFASRELGLPDNGSYRSTSTCIGHTSCGMSLPLRSSRSSRSSG